jgi:hypothetical protein
LVAFDGTIAEDIFQNLMVHGIRDLLVVAPSALCPESVIFGQLRQSFLVDAEGEWIKLPVTDIFYSDFTDIGAVENFFLPEVHSQPCSASQFRGARVHCHLLVDVDDTVMCTMYSDDHRISLFTKSTDSAELLMSSIRSRMPSMMTSP